MRIPKLDIYGNVANKPLNEETSAIYNILQELKGKYAADVASVGINHRHHAEQPTPQTEAPNV